MGLFRKLFKAAAEPPDSGDSPEAFLKWSMDRYGGFSTFRASCIRRQIDQFNTGPQLREIRYEAPNKFKIVSKIHESASVSVCNGEEMIEYSSNEDLPVRTGNAPDSLSTAAMMTIAHPMFCGTLLWRFFAGSDAYSRLVQVSKGPVSYGSAEPVLGGEQCRVVSFYGGGDYGNVQMTIGTKTGLVYEITYDWIEIRKKMAAGQGDMPPVAFDPHSKVIETYNEIVTEYPIDAATFSIEIPDGFRKPNDIEVKVKAETGAPAPELEVTDIASGNRVKLTDFLGKHVLLVLWMPSSPASMKFIQRVQAARAQFPKELAVIAVSMGHPQMLKQFVDEEKIDLPVYATLNTTQLFKFICPFAFPTVALIDPQGVLRALEVPPLEDGVLDSVLAKI